jgi:hypothetical protein
VQDASRGDRGAAHLLDAARSSHSDLFLLPAKERVVMDLMQCDASLEFAPGATRNPMLSLYGVDDRAGQLLAEISVRQILQMLKEAPDRAAYMRQDLLCACTKA